MESIVTEWDSTKAEKARRLCDAFSEAPPSKRYVFGRNVYAAAVASIMEIAGFVDDFTSASESGGIPIFRTQDIPRDAIVLAASGGRPLTVRRLLDDRGLKHLDYFALLRWGGLNLPEAVFNEGFREIFADNRDNIAWLESRLGDEKSREVLHKLFSFRFTYDLDFLNGFTDRQSAQYFEPFLDIHRRDAVFVDVGGFDGFTSEEFVRRSPEYRAVYVFEPDAANYARCKERLAEFRDVNLLPYGAGDQNAKVRFASDGSASAIRHDGEVEIQVRRIDDVVAHIPTFIKMDIEGAELAAIYGARRTIKEHRPALALSVYHRPSDFWEVPQAILSMSPAYDIYLRHYTESIYETVMYFVPRDTKKV